MRSILTVTTPASDLQLLTIDELREAAGVTDGSQNQKLTALGLKIAADIASECNIAVGAGAVPTLRRETLTEVFRSVCSEVIVLGRRHDVAITSVVVDGETLAVSAYEVEPETGIVTRLESDEPIAWHGSKVTVVYDAGFANVPPDLAHAASDFARLVWREKERDPSVKASEKDIPGVIRTRTELWAGALPGQGGEGAVPDVVAGQLKRFRNVVVG